jgi:hypothetical protein
MWCTNNHPARHGFDSGTEYIEHLMEEAGIREEAFDPKIGVWVLLRTKDIMAAFGYGIDKDGDAVIRYGEDGPVSFYYNTLKYSHITGEDLTRPILCYLHRGDNGAVVLAINDSVHQVSGWGWIPPDGVAAIMSGRVVPDKVQEQVAWFGDSIDFHLDDEVVLRDIDDAGHIIHSMADGRGQSHVRAYLSSNWATMQVKEAERQPRKEVIPLRLKDQPLRVVEIRDGVGDKNHLPAWWGCVERRLIVSTKRGVRYCVPESLVVRFKKKEKEKKPRKSLTVKERLAIKEERERVFGVYARLKEI